MMKVGELIAYLETFDKDALVVVEAGDDWASEYLTPDTPKKVRVRPLHPGKGQEFCHDNGGDRDAVLIAITLAE